MEPSVPESETPEVAPEPVAQPSAGPACANCGAGLADGQEWCLECGTAVRSGRSALPGWRTGAATLAVTAVLASGAVAAAYAAIRSDEDAPAAGGATVLAQVDPGVPTPPPIDIPSEEEVPSDVAPPPDASAAVPPPAVPPDATAEVPVDPGLPAAPVIPAAPIAPAVPVTPAPPSGTPTDPGTGSDSGNGNGGRDDAAPITRAALVEVPLDPEKTVATNFNPTTAASTTPDPTATTPAEATTTPTDPTATTPAPAPAPGAAHADADFTGEPKLAFDGDPATAWSVALGTPALVAEPQAGLVIDLATATKLRRLTLTPTTPGTTIEVYGTKTATAPASLDDKSWKLLATQLDVAGRTKITLGEDGVGTGNIRRLLIYFSAGPDDGTSTSVGISELKLYR